MGIEQQQSACYVLPPPLFNHTGTRSHLSVDPGVVDVVVAHLFGHHGDPAVEDALGRRLTWQQATGGARDAGRPALGASRAHLGGISAAHGRP